ncbi:hypothetical protein HUT19_33535 [Streptomyces sp. NA02950]|uniref:hypothetical protein n=1 Tax=Streptomyces sp. NA02950 TaxID=2742137 RepID=UPI00158FFD6B|nr:hypothetical protein [Streptomyces sp. NA02950]QKV96046.1 hypothetical protein HUT19_33535 [Streptomyces sp. NA02950]
MSFTLRTRSYLAAAAFLAGTALLTACQDTAKGADGSASTSAPAASSTRGDSAVSDKTAPKGKGVSGTFSGGTVEYLAPGKYIVNAQGKEQQFWVADDTKVFGAGTICGPYNSAADTPCTVDDLEKILKDGSIAADVVMKNGVADTVTERPAPDEGAPAEDSGNESDSSDQAQDKPKTEIDGINKGKGVNGTWLGNVKYLAPSKYTVSDMKGSEQAFFVAEDTDIWGYGSICGDDNTEEGGQGGTQCTEDELEAATKSSGVSAQVVIENGIATTITEDH